MFRTVFKFFFLSLVPAFTLVFAQTPYQDLSHESKVFGHKKEYRLYLPKTYSESTKRYPVIYFFHGWGGRHFMDDNAKLEYEKLQSLVDKYQVIMVMWDGNIDLKEPRPYNVGNHEDVKFQVQMKDYFPEFVAHVDKTYRTFSDRDHRGIIGFSMGGFMSFYLSGKYPHMVSAAVSIMGSPEFFVGWPERHTLYPVRYTFANLQDVRFRVHTSPTDILYFLNQEVKAGAQWEGKPIEFEEFPGGHMIDFPGGTQVFEKAMKFVTAEFGTPHRRPQKWSHYDLYDEFQVWDYKVKGDLTDAGFIYLKDVSRKGFGIYTKKWLPHGPAREVKQLAVSTAPVYNPETEYQIATYRKNDGNVTTGVVSPNEKGSIRLMCQPESETGIYSAEDTDNWIFADHSINGKHRLQIGTNRIAVKIFNRGNSKHSGRKLKVILSSPDPAIRIPDSVKVVDKPSGRIMDLPGFLVLCNKKPPLHADPADIRLKIKIIDGENTEETEIAVPVNFDVPYFTNIKIDDGKNVRNKALGKGNGDGKAGPGESLALYEGDHRLRIYADDNRILNQAEQFTDEMIPARWPDGFTQQSIIQIAPDAIAGQEIECLSSYETKTFNPIERKVTWGKVKLIISK